jgi:hypothetical protein
MCRGATAINTFWVQNRILDLLVSDWPMYQTRIRSIRVIEAAAAEATTAKIATGDQTLLDLKRHGKEWRCLLVDYPIITVPISIDDCLAQDSQVDSSCRVFWHKIKTQINDKKASRIVLISRRRALDFAV